MTKANKYLLAGVIAGMAAGYILQPQLENLPVWNKLPKAG